MDHSLNIEIFLKEPNIYCAPNCYVAWMLNLSLIDTARKQGNIVHLQVNLEPWEFTVLWQAHIQLDGRRDPLVKGVWP